MTLTPETKLLGLRGLHIEARRREDADAAHHFAKEAHAIAPVPWAGAAMLEHLAAQGDWEKAREAIEASLAAKAIDAPTAQNLRAVVETAMAMEKERDHPHDALHLARQALKRRPGFAPAAVAAARVLVRHGDRKQALKLIETVWATKPHPDLAAAYLEALSGESNDDRLARVERLARDRPQCPGEPAYRRRGRAVGPQFRQGPRGARAADRRGRHPTAHTCLLMAEIEDGEQGPSGPVREWLARGSRAPRDPVWIADGVVSKNWLPMSPVTGRLDAFEWKPPPDSAQHLTEEGKPNIPAAFLTRPAEPVALPAGDVSGKRPLDSRAAWTAAAGNAAYRAPIGPPNAHVERAFAAVMARGFAKAHDHVAQIRRFEPHRHDAAQHAALVARQPLTRHDDGDARAIAPDIGAGKPSKSAAPRPVAGREDRAWRRPPAGRV